MGQTGLGLMEKKGDVNGSACAFATQDGPRRLQENLDTQPKRPTVGIFEIETDHIIEGGPASSLDLPKSCNSRLDLEHPASMSNVIVHYLI